MQKGETIYLATFPDSMLELRSNSTGFGGRTAVMLSRFQWVKLVRQCVEDLRSLSNLGNVAPLAAISGSTVSRNIVHGFSLSLKSIICVIANR